MGEEKQKRLRLDAMLAAEKRCVYCGNLPSTIEHMPPISMFRSRHRLKGMEFAACASCNNGTRGADVTAAFLARISIEPDAQMTEESARLRSALTKDAPGVLEEFLHKSKASLVWHPGRSGKVLRKLVAVTLDGPLTRTYLTVFSAKLGMALYREHIGAPLPLTGGVQLKFFPNANLNDQQAADIIKIMPLGGTLKQGTVEATWQFAYRFNHDGSSIVAALVGFHSNFHVLAIATSKPDFFNFPITAPGFSFVRPGELVGLLSQRLQNV